MTFRELVQLAVRGGPGFLQVAVTNACNAHCRFCIFPQVATSAWRMADPARLARGLAATQQAGIKYVCVTGEGIAKPIFSHPERREGSIN
jgi:tRNA A37 methylthiotransferase MiaB